MTGLGGLVGSRAAGAGGWVWLRGRAAGGVGRRVARRVGVMGAGR